MTIQKQLAVTIKKIFSTRKDVEIPALLGDKSGTIKADNNGNVYVTFWNGETIIVRNQSVANQRHWVIVGYRNNVLQVLRSWDVFSDASFPDVPEHDHTWGKSTNPSYIRKEQFLDGLAVPGTGLSVDFYGCWFQLDGVVHVLPNQTIDLTAQIPTSDARWCNVEVDASSVITFNTGSSKANRALLLPEDIPATASTKKLLFSVKTYLGQTSFIKEVADTDFFDARFTGMGGGPALAVDWTNITSIPATFSPDLTVTDPLYPRKWLKTADPTVNDDTSIGYAKLDVWLNQASSQVFICTDDTDGAAVWLPVGSNGGAPVIFSVDGTLAVLTSAAVPFLVTQDLTISSWYIYCEDNGSASSTIVDVNKNSTTVFTTQANRPTLSNSDPDNWAVSGTPDVTTFVEGDVISIDIDQIATGAKNMLIVGFVSSTGGGGGAFNLTLEDMSAGVSVSNVGKIVIPDGFLQDNGGGEVQLSIIPIRPLIAVAPSGTKTTTSSSYADVDGSNMEVTITKKMGDTDILLDVRFSLYTTAQPVRVVFAVNEAGSDYEIHSRDINSASNHVEGTTLKRISGLAAGSHTFRLRWKRTSGSGTVTMDANDRVYLSAQEVY